MAQLFWTGLPTVTGHTNFTYVFGFENVIGSSGADRIQTSGGKNIIDAGAGDDWIGGSTGGDFITGGAGTDSFDYALAAGNLTINLADTTKYNANGQVDANGTFIKATHSGSSDIYLSGIENLYGGYGNDTLTGDSGDNILGTGAGGTDTLSGGAGDDRFVITHINGDGLSFSGGTGSDTLDYSGIPAYTGLTIDLTQTSTTIAYFSGISNVSNTHYFSGIENVTGSTLADTLKGDENANILEGGQGADTLTGGAGNDIFVLDLRASHITTTDTVKDFSPGDKLRIDLSSPAMRTAFGQARYQALIQKWATSGLAALVLADLGLRQAAADLYYTDTAGTERKIATLENWTASLSIRTHFDLLIDGSLAGIRLGTSNNDTLIGTAGDDTLDALDGVDTLRGLAGDDILIGGLGGDALDGGAGSDTAAYAGSNAAVTVNLSTGTATGGHATGDSFTSIENLTGSRFDDRLTGDSGSNILDGRAGADILDGKGGSDWASYRTNDKPVNINLNVALQATWSATTHTITSANAGQLVMAERAANGSWSVVLKASGTTETNALVRLGTVNAAGDGLVSGHDSRIAMGTGSDAGKIIVSASTLGGGHADGDQLLNIENIFGSTHNDTVIANDAVNQIDGGAGLDTVSYEASDAGVRIDMATGRGTGGHAAGDQLKNIEKIIGSAHNDSFVATAAHESFFGGTGSDTVDYSASTKAVNIDLRLTFHAAISGSQAYAGSVALSAADAGKYIVARPRNVGDLAPPVHAWAHL